ncbi:hypothetical protein MMC25_002618 [Agyrium rufum]|nr:hypothetical protein [Agyrium rufum]
MIEELRSVPCPTKGVSNLSGGPIHDDRLPGTSSWGPFGTISDFHVALRNNVTLKCLENPQSQDSASLVIHSDLRQIATFHESMTSPPVLTHGDLSSLNILIRGDQVVGIVDWETAGWLLYYWEYTTAWHANPQNMFWQDEVDNFLDPLAEELSMDKLRRMYFGELYFASLPLPSTD